MASPDFIAIGARAMQESKAWPAVFKAGSAAVLAEACLTAVERAKGNAMAKSRDKVRDADLDQMDQMVGDALKRRSSLDILEAELADLVKSRRIQTEEGRALGNFVQRLVETLRHGEPKTPPIGEGSHHA